MMSGEPAPENLIYLFCLADKMPETGENVKNIGFFLNNGLCAVTGTVAGGDFCGERLERNLNDIEWVEEKVRFHEQVVEKMMSAATVIPFKFGTVFKTEENLKKMLDEYFDTFKEILKRLEGKREWGIKIYCDRKALGRSVEKEGPFGGAEKQMGVLSPGRAFFHRKKQERVMSELVDGKICGVSREVFEALRGHCAEARVNPLPAEARRQRDMVFNAAFLVADGGANAFMDEVELLKDKYCGFEMECTGPWPPYNFCAVEEHESAERK